jgi:hypothetical protein
MIADHAHIVRSLHADYKTEQKIRDDESKKAYEKLLLEKLKLQEMLSRLNDEISEKDRLYDDAMAELGRER